MSDWPGGLSGVAGILSPWGPDSAYAAMNNSGWANRATWNANQAIIASVFVPNRVTAQGFAWVNGSAVSGNVDCGIYDKNGALLSSLGSTAQAGTSQTQTAALGSPLAVTPGNYFVAISISSATAAFLAGGGSSNGSGGLLQGMGIFVMNTAFPLPGTLVPANPSGGTGWIPVFSALVSTSVL